MLEVVPPGMQPMIRMPILIGSGTGRLIASRKAINGMNPYCEATPINRP
jgi:hypothetical protein